MVKVICGFRFEPAAEKRMPRLSERQYIRDKEEWAQCTKQDRKLQSYHSRPSKWFTLERSLHSGLGGKVVGYGYKPKQSFQQRQIKKTLNGLFPPNTRIKLL